MTNNRDFVRRLFGRQEPEPEREPTMAGAQSPREGDNPPPSGDDELAEFVRHLFDNARHD